MATKTLTTLGAATFVPAASSGAVLTYVNNRSTLLFDDTTEWTAYSGEFAWPQSAEGNALTARVVGAFESEVTATDEAVIGVSIEAITPSADAVDLDAVGEDSWATELEIEIDPVAGAGDPAVGTGTLTDDGVQPGDLVRLRLARKVGAAADTATGDFEFHALAIEEA